MNEWPSALPGFLREPYRSKPAPQGVRAKPGLGPIPQRRRSSAGVTMRSYQLYLSAAELAIFWSFWRNDCAAGNLAFRMADPIRGDVCTFRFIADETPEETIDEHWHVINFVAERIESAAVAE